MLEHETTLALIKEAKQGSESAKQTLIEHNYALIKSIIRRFRNKGAEFDDLMQLGSMGFLKAIANFDESFGVKFSTYAVPMIAGEVKRFLRDDGYIKISRSIKSLAGKIAHFTDNYRKQHNSEPDVEMIAKALNVEPQEIVFALDAGRFPISLYERSDDGDEKSQSLMDKISATDNSEDVLDKLLLKDIIEKLPEKERKIILLRYYRDKTQSEISEIMGVSQVQISRMEAKIIKKMRERFIS